MFLIDNLLCNIYISIFRMLESTVALGPSPGHFAQLVLAWNDLLPQIKFPASRIFVRRTWKEESRSSVHDLMRDIQTTARISRLNGTDIINMTMPHHLNFKRKCVETMTLFSLF